MAKPFLMIGTDIVVEVPTEYITQEQLTTTPLGYLLAQYTMSATFSGDYDAFKQAGEEVYKKAIEITGSEDIAKEAQQLYYLSVLGAASVVGLQDALDKAYKAVTQMEKSGAPEEEAMKKALDIVDEELSGLEKEVSDEFKEFPLVVETAKKMYNKIADYVKSGFEE
ncbi:MAG: hypothetical protein J7K22_04550 [Nanoarchaeota archaeon]|nr:hypothetical protein [Nanoarchaeota archaeon]